MQRLPVQCISIVFLSLIAFVLMQAAKFPVSWWYSLFYLLLAAWRKLLRYCLIILARWGMMAHGSSLKLQICLPFSNHLQINGTHNTHIHTIQHCDSQNILQNWQNGFRKHHTWESQLIITTEELKRSIDQKKQEDTVAHTKLISKLQNYEIQGKNNNWINRVNI